MKEFNFSWEIVTSAVLLTVCAVYFASTPASPLPANSGSASTQSTIAEDVHKASAHMAASASTPADFAINKAHISLTSAQNNSDLTVSEETFDAASINDVSLKTSGGNINIVGGSSDRVHVRIYATGRDATIENVEDRYEVTLKKVGNSILAEVKQKDRSIWSSFRSNNISMNIEVETARSMQFDARTSGGNISAADLDGSQSLSTSGGNISLLRMNGSSVAKTSGGNIRAEDLDGTFKLSTSGGNISFDRCAGDIDASTSGGNMTLDFISGTLQASTSGGSVRANVHEVTDDVKLSTSGGNISLYIPIDSEADIFARGSSVSVDSDFNVQGVIKRNEIDAKLNGGGPILTCRTSGGSVQIRSL